MALYIMLTTLTGEGKKTIQHNPEGIKQVNKEVEEMGGKVLAQYALLGHYDFVNILDAPDNETIVRIAMDLGARGTMVVQTMAAITVDEFISGCGKAGK